VLTWGKKNKPGMMEGWKVGRLESWIKEFLFLIFSHYSTIPLFQFSKIEDFRCYK
jgi:hypothetical protein